jgi:4-amino-4-deoxy-L-arabinose transferase-like glycosyltransferase
MDAGSTSLGPRTWLALAALLGVVLRLAFGLLYWTHQPLTRDELEYLSLARSLAAGHGFTYDAVMRSGSFVPFGRAPGYPAFLALVGGGTDVVTAVPPSVKIAQSFVGGLGVVLAGLVARRLAGGRAGAAAALVAAVYPPLVWIAAYAWSEAIFWPIGLLVVWLFDRLRDRPDRAAGALVCGLLVAAGVLTRPALLLFLPLAGAYLLARRRVRQLAGLALGVALVLGPWTVRNYVQHGRWMIVASDGGVTFWTGNHPLAVGEGDMAANPALKLDNLRLRADHPGLTEEQMEPIYYREALTWMRAHPRAWVWLEVRKLFYLVVPLGPSYAVHSRRYVAASLVSYGAVLALALVGAARLGSRLRATPGLWLLVASAVLTCLVFFPQERFRIPVIDPALVILGAAGLAAPARARDMGRTLPA